MQRSLACDIKIAFEGMAGNGSIWISGWNAIPIEIDPCNLNLLDLD